MIVVTNLNKSFGKINAINNLNLHIKKGKIHGIVGPEASGKTTVLRILAGLVFHDSGDIVIDGHPINNGMYIRNITGFVPETPSLPLEYTTRELVTFKAHLHGIYDKNIINRILIQTGLDAVADQSLTRYSISMKKNVTIAMALVNDPKILLLDEPMKNIDPISKNRFKDYIMSSNKTVIITGVDLNSLEDLCNSVTVLKRGSVVIDGEISSIRQRVGKGAIEIKLYDFNQIQKLLFELEKHGKKITISGDSVYVKFENKDEIPEIIKISANTVDIIEAKYVSISIDDIFTHINKSEIL